MKKTTMILAVVALTLTSAWAKDFSIKVMQPTVVAGTEFKPGDYRVELNGTKMTFTNGSKAVVCDVKVEATGQKYAQSSLRSEETGGKLHAQEIRLRGTDTKLVLTEPAGAVGGR